MCILFGSLRANKPLRRQYQYESIKPTTQLHSLTEVFDTTPQTVIYLPYNRGAEIRPESTLVS